MSSTSIYTIGHSNTDLAAFLKLLRAHDIQQIADVRSYPTSRRLPHFSRDILEQSLATANTRYRWFKALGGLRKPKPNSPHIGWQVAGFRSYADHMETPEFDGALSELLDWAEDALTSLLCSERLWWQCHRRLLSDKLVTRGRRVLHILSDKSPEPHHLTDFLRLDGDHLIYDRTLFTPNEKA